MINNRQDSLWKPPQTKILPLSLIDTTRDLPKKSRKTCLKILTAIYECKGFESCAIESCTLLRIAGKKYKKSIETLIELDCLICENSHCKMNYNYYQILTNTKDIV
jgi:hypothetical protein